MDSSRQVKILLADKLVDSVRETLAGYGFAVRNEPQLTSADLEQSLGDTDILVVRSTRVTEQALRNCDQLSLVIRAGAGVNTIDVATASALASLIEIHDLGTTSSGPGRHAMLTTGDVAAFRETAGRLFGEDLGPVEALVLQSKSTGDAA